jgi:hypothetical protein
MYILYTYTLRIHFIFEYLWHYFIFYDEFCERMRYYAFLTLKFLLIVLGNVKPDDDLE